MQSLKVALFLCHVVACGASVFDWYETPYDESSFNTRAEFGTNATLECANSLYPNTSDDSLAQVQYWITPDLMILRPGDEHSENTREGRSLFVVSPDGILLELINIDQIHFGFYYCMVNYSSELVVVKKGLNYEGPYYGDLWEKYETGVIVGAVAAGVVLLLLAIGCIIDICCCPKRSNQQKEPDHYENGGYTVTDSGEGVAAITTSSDEMPMKTMKPTNGDPPPYDEPSGAYNRTSTHF